MARKKRVAKKRRLPEKDNEEETLNVKSIRVKTNQNSKPFIINVKPIPEDALFLGTVCIGTLTEGCFDEDDAANKIFVCEHESFLIYVKLSIDVEFIKGIVLAQHFTYKVEKSKDTEIQMKVYFLYLPDMEHTRKVAKTNHTILSHIFPDDFSSDYNEDNFNKKHDLNEFYETVKKVQQFQNVQFNCQLKPPQQLVPTLRPYQAAAVNWMLEREHNVKKAYYNPEYKKIVLPAKITIFYNKLTSHITIEEPLINSMPTGGILADEMGLGKTVEVLACILMNPRKNIKYSTYNSCDLTDTEPVAVLHDNKIKRTSVQRSTAANASRKRSRTPVDSDDERSLEDIRTSLRKKKSKISSDSDEEYEPDIKLKNTSGKIDEDFICQRTVRNEKPKGSVAKRAAQLWYENKLAEVNINPLKQRTSMAIDIQCLCGELTGHGSYVICVQCRKRQHRRCMDYTDDKRDYYCPQCWEKKPPVVSGATLIVSPNSISRQWVTEIKRHIKQNGLKVLIYRGVKKAGYIYPVKLAQYDLVITTYSVLSSELNFVGVEDNHRLRFAKRYYTASSPLPTIEWWRVCLDEAQMVDCATSMVADMARQLPAIHRWAVSGTPAQHGITDLHGLVSFLGIEPYNNKAAWDKLLYIPYCYGDRERLHNFLAGIMWRSSKKEVIDQINIPKQSEQVHWLKFSAVEDFFYKREHEMCADDLKFRLNMFESLDVTLDSIDKKTLSKLMLPLLSVRQACIHPRVVRGRYLTTVKNATSLEDLLKALITKNKIECEDSLRANIAALNGIAGIHMIQDEWNEAAEAYREVLRLMEHHNGHLKIDTLQQLHVLCNLAELLELKHPNANIPPTLRDHQLRDQANALEDKYMQKHIACIQKAEEDCSKAHNAVQKAESKFKMPAGAWVPEIIDWLGENDFADELVERIRTTLTDYQVDKHSNIKSSFTSSWKIICEISVWNDKILKSISKLRSDFVKLKTEYENNRFSENMVSSVVNCHLRPLNKNDQTAKKCCFCKVEVNLLDYERLIFLMTTKQKKQKRKVPNSEDDEDDKNKGSWKSSQQEVVLKVILTYSQRKGVAQDLIEDGETHMKLCGALRREFKELRRLWTYYCDQIAAQDELIMCKQRLRLRLPNEPLPNQGRKLLVLKNLDYNIENRVEHINIIDPPTLNMQFQLLNTDKQTAAAELSKRLGTLKYLETLSKQRYTGQNPELCPICRNQLTDNWSVLPCGHSFCLECIHRLLEKYSCGKSVTCSVCREVQSLQNISYVRLKEDNSTDNNDSIVGSYSTKIEAVVKCVLSLKRDDPDVKVLIFSTWPRVLNVMSEAFAANNITFEIFCNSGNLDQLERFKDKKEGITALLLPVHSGAKGLNLVEATHVLLIEPLLNPAEELQAIGRIHRIGQTRATVVHRFLIQNTIEENIHYAVSSNIVDWNNKDRITLHRLYNLFQEYKHNDANSSETKSE